MTSIWISSTAFQDLVHEASRVYPLETGGVLIGYRAENRDIVIMEIIGPGPRAIHQRRKFTPDHSWQCNQLDAAYDHSSATFVYLGDWHTHPDGIPQMSWLDRRTHRAIARHPQAQTPHPLMLIGGCTPRGWTWLGHIYCGDRLFGALTESKQVDPRLFQPI
jgi:integrative and conjugative element protein (TIGR02256 family)